MNSDATNGGDDIAARVADTLKRAFEVVATAPLPADEKGRWHHRLIVITNTSKHDVGRAWQQLRRFIDEWNALGRGKEIVQ